MNTDIVKISEQLSLVCLENEQETISLTEMWKQYAPKDKKGDPLKQHQPNTWLGLEYTRRVISSIVKKLRINTAQSKEYVYKFGRSGTYAHFMIALCYLHYLNTDMYVEAVEYFARMKLGDVSIFDELYDNTTKEGKIWLEERAAGKQKRRIFTDTLQEHGVQMPVHYAQCTNAIYEGVAGKTALEIRKENGVDKKTPLRDTFSETQLKIVKAAETLASVVIEIKDLRGYTPCKSACIQSGENVRQFIDKF